MENRYYYVPVVARRVFLEDHSLMDVTAIVDEQLSLREENRVILTYENSSEKDQNLSVTQDIIDKYNSETSLLYKEKGLPERIVIVQNDKGTYELASEVELSAPNQSYLDCFEVSGIDVVDIFYEQPNYPEMANKYFKIYNKKKRFFQKKKS